MSSPASLTFIVVTATRISRADFDSSTPTPRGFWTAGRSSNSPTPAAVAQALSLGGRAGRNVWVLCEDAWTQSLDLARGQVSGLSNEQIARALSFEIEPFSGIAVTESALGFLEAEERQDVKSYWVVETTTAVRDAIQRAVTAAGGRLAGICHPGGVPLPIEAPASGQPWRRLESWSGSYVWVEGNERREVRARALAAAPILPPPPAGTTFEALAASPSALVATLDPAITWQQFSLEEEAALQQWLSAWAAVVQRGQPAVPVILPPAPKPTPRKFIMAAIAIEAVLLALCLLDGWRSSAERDDLKKQLAEITTTTQQTQARGKENAALKKQLAELEDQAQKRAHLAERRTAMPALLRALASTRPDDVVLSSIKPGTPGNLVVSGLALEATSVDEMSVVLTETLRPAGWFAQPLQKNARGSLPNSGPWEFDINVSQETPNAASFRPPTRRAP